MADWMLIALGALALAAVQGLGVIFAVLIDAREGREAAANWWFTTCWLLWMPAALAVGVWLHMADRRAAWRLRNFTRAEYEKERANG